MKRICVYCGSNPGSRPEYLASATELGELLAEKDIEIVYGGAEVGLMGAVASAAINHGGKVTGVIPETFAGKIAHDHLSELHVVPTMHARKTKMFDLSDGFIALPGGLGTLEEAFEIFTWAQLGFHEKPCGLLNVCGYFDRILEFLDHSVSQQFVKRAHREMVLVDHHSEGLLMQFDSYQAPRIQKWMNAN